MKKQLKVLELFGGIGACSKALERLGIDYEIADYVEIDKYAVKSFNAIHNTNFEPQDITKWNKDIEVDLIMHESPCQDFSLAGKQAGGDEGTGTRSSLMYETIRIVKKLKPKYVIWENVKNLLSKKHRHNFDAYLETMEQLGYKNYYQVLNAKDYGIPQNRERVFTVSIRDDSWGGNTIGNPDDTYNEDYIANYFEFPTKKDLKLKLKDMLENEVDEKYYLSEDKIDKISHWKAYQKPFEKVQGKNSIVPTLTARGAGEEHSGMITYCDNLKDTTNLQEQCLHIKNATKKGYQEAHDGDKVRIRKYPVDTNKLITILRIHKNYTNKEISLILNKPITLVEHWFRNDSCFTIPDDDIWIKLKTLLKINTDEFDESIMTFIEKDGVYEKSNRCYLEDGISPTLTSTSANEKIVNNLRIRKLTPKECWRLMGFDDEDFEKAAKVNSNRQLYKQAGNSIVVNVLEAILNNLLICNASNTN